MGMYSRLDYEDIEVKDYEGLKHFLLEFAEITGNDSYLDLIKQDDKTFSFWGLYDDTKLIGYWYDEDVLLFRNISKYIEGKVRWIYETDEQMAIIRFENGKTTFEIGEMCFDIIDLDIRQNKPFTNEKNEFYTKYKEFEKKHQFIGSL